MKKINGKFGGMIFCVIELAVGILLLINPEGFTSSIIAAMGAIAVVAGIVCAVKYFKTPIDTAVKEQFLTKGLILVLLGAFAIFGNGWIMKTFPIVTVLYGVIMLVFGISKVQFVTDSIRKKEDRWFLGIISAVLSIACAAVVLLNPFTTTKILWMFTGISMIADAVFDAAAVIFIKKPETASDNGGSENSDI